MDALKKARDRVGQAVMESVGSATKTELPPELLARVAAVEDMKTHFEKLLAAFTV